MANKQTSKAKAHTPAKSRAAKKATGTSAATASNGSPSNGSRSSGPKAKMPEPRRAATGYKKGAETRERLITAAQQAIHELGFNRASSREIARRSGLTFGVIQHHFGSYEAVLLAAVAREGDRLQETLATAEIAGNTVEERLACVADLVWNFVSRPENLVYMEIHSNLMRDPETSAEALELLHGGTQRIEELWLDLMREAFDQQEPDPGLRRLLFATMRGLAITAWMNQGELTFERERAIFVEAMAPYFDRRPARSKQSRTGSTRRVSGR
jgi:TetR/AcrR family transcriptional regulator, regulator of cefoperazone and chloramphenicol sensitivity